MVEARDLETHSSEQVDGKSNPKIQTIHLERFPVKKASFSADGEHIVATGLKNKLFYIYDMMEGKIVPVMNVQGERRTCVFKSLVKEFMYNTFLLNI